MSYENKPYNILVAREYESGGSKKTQWINAGVAFKTKDGEGFSGTVVNGLALTGRFMILPRSDRANDDGAQGQEE